MKKVLIIYFSVAFLWFLIYCILISDVYLTIKYEIEVTKNDILVDKIYQISNTGIILNIIWFIISTAIMLILYIRKNYSKTA
ncbi:hypothetical protein EJ73_02773 [Hoylesella shahii DSM 15611 = JCM 12083]|jgi:hypothetical protein|uniref:Uncharacterized protein n=1 Tax=Hoylesella shahii DSM 15611 = JCM 12083 TaxID=1122991 RepID=A0A318HPZ2_9BACT|nr:hypothetical protein EJ73_02773 [Hoylesella shahii DSM 15611 = JCM 12083]